LRLNERIAFNEPAVSSARPPSSGRGRQENAMRDVVRTRSVPQIIVSDTDYERLTDLASASLERQPEVANELLSEMDRAKVVEAAQVPADVVRMGSTVTFRSDDGQTRTLTLVYPADESLDQHRISVMTPVGAALIGLGEGQSISWTARDGRRHELTVVKVS
jgi:regulator of nucleoside diphosphate kinase